ncbi:MAG TPA: class I SAM-dependent methyltransferase [Burkholderiaceae bacterium]|jgi:SAM-dependent methyltransferase|nr:class I SAM-dependent methyltransferase [Burkholderiaceae bacterium]
MKSDPGREFYGIDAPTIVRNLGAGGIALVGVALVARNYAWGAAWADNLVLPGGCMAAMAAWMLASSLWLKQRVMRSLLAQRDWRGDERVLDIGCGRGLVSVEAARRVSTGRVVGIDLWQASDLSGNGVAAILGNARAAGVEARLQIDTGDARALPYPDASFDVVTSMTVIHNIPDAAGRRAAIAEAWRVLAPGGQMLVFDIRHASTYLAQLRALGAKDARLSAPILLWGLPGRRFSLRKSIREAPRVHAGT